METGCLQYLITSIMQPGFIFAEIAGIDGKGNKVISEVKSKEPAQFNLSLI